MMSDQVVEWIPSFEIGSVSIKRGNSKLLSVLSQVCPTKTNYSVKTSNQPTSLTPSDGLLWSSFLQWDCKWFFKNIYIMHFDAFLPSEILSLSACFWIFLACFRSDLTTEINSSLNVDAAHVRQFFGHIPWGRESVCCLTNIPVLQQNTPAQTILVTRLKDTQTSHAWCTLIFWDMLISVFIMMADTHGPRKSLSHPLFLIESLPNCGREAIKDSRPSARRSDLQEHEIPPLDSGAMNLWSAPTICWLSWYPANLGWITNVSRNT